MTVNNSESSDFVCEICLNNYDTISRKPYSLVPCGHTFCLSCMNQITSKICPTCRAIFQNKIPNWEITKRLERTINHPSAPPINNNNQASSVSQPARTCMDDFFSMSSKRKFAFFYNTFLAMVAAIYPTALLWVAFEHHSECKIDSLIPIWMIIYGFFGDVMIICGFILLQYLMIKPKNTRSKCVLSICTISFSLVSLFEMIWFFVGTVWVFKVYPKVSYNPYNLNEPSTTYCEPTMFKFAFGTLVAQCCLFGIFICISPCLMCCLPWRRLNEL